MGLLKYFFDEGGGLKSGWTHAEFVTFCYLVNVAKTDKAGRLVAEVLNGEIQKGARVGLTRLREIKDKLTRAGLLKKLPHRHGRGVRERYILNLPE